MSLFELQMNKMTDPEILHKARDIKAQVHIKISFDCLRYTGMASATILNLYDAKVSS